MPVRCPLRCCRLPSRCHCPCAWFFWGFRARARTGSTLKLAYVALSPVLGDGSDRVLQVSVASHACSRPRPQRLVSLLEHTLRTRTPAGVQGWDPAHTGWSWRPLGAVYNIRYEVVHVGGTLLAQYEQVGEC